MADETRIIAQHHNGDSVITIARKCETTPDVVREVLTDRGFLLVGRDAGKEHMTTNYADGERIYFRALPSKKIAELFRVWRTAA